LFADIERDLCAAGEVPLSLSPQRAAIEARMVEAWSQGENPALSIVCNEVAGL
jgi:hypothetical protein